jgi:hypothetical protein
MAGLFGIVDTAREPRLYGLVTQSPNHLCLFAGELAPALRQAAPYLVELTDETPLKAIWRDEGWGRAWGLLLRSSLDLKALRRHLRRFLLAQLPDGRTALFRFYDPRVWNTYWANCAPAERTPWLEGIDEFMAEPSSGPA